MPPPPVAIDPPALSVGAGYARRLFDLVERFGLPRDALRRHAAPRLAGWEPTQARIPLSALLALFDSALTLTGRRDLALEFGRQVRPDTFDVLGYALMTCRNLGEAIGLVPLYRRVVFDSGYSETQFGREGADVKLAWVILPEATQAGLPYSELLAESLIASWCGLGRWITGADLPLREVRFRHAAPEDPVPFANFFGCPVRFAAGENALLFAADLLTRPLLQADAELNLAMCDEARKAIARLDGETHIAARVRQMLTPLMPKCEATLNHVAAGMGITPRTLQRRLATADFSFQAVLDDTRRELAQVYLRDAALSALDVALLLGYAEQSSFTRAFRHWFGTTPSAWRAQHLPPN
ncbi:MAG: AraC family transcriptional regulator [Rhodocyclales bacterium]|nr:AraC family transcriptional regulator [Rhodocyclales bacterium]